MTKRLWIIDAAYMLRACKSLGTGYKFDYLKLRAKLEETGRIWRAYYLNSVNYLNSIVDYQAERSESFHYWLELAPPDGPGMSVRLYDLKSTRVNRAFCVECGTEVGLTCPGGNGHQLNRLQQKGVDVGIATLALKLHQDYDTLLLSSGDGDLLDAVEFLRECDKQIELVVFRSGVSRELQSQAHLVHWLDDFKDDIRK